MAKYVINSKYEKYEKHDVEIQISCLTQTLKIVKYTPHLTIRVNNVHSGFPFRNIFYS